MVEKYGNFIGGQWVASQSSNFQTYNPANYDDCIGTFVNSSKEDVDLAVKAAVSAAKSWAATPGPERAVILQKVAEKLLTHQDELARIITWDMGKPLGESHGEINKAIAECHFMVGEGYRLYGFTTPSHRKNTWAQTVRVPVGPVAAIAPWNFPVLSPMRKFMPALIAGNPIVFKPSEFSPLTGLRLVEILSQVLPPGVINAVTGGGRTGEALVNHPEIKAISFTGSVSTGRKINEAGARRLIPVQAEMGGKNPVVLWDPPNLTDAIQQIENTAFACSGQRCTAISRVIVPKEDLEKVESEFLKLTEKRHLGDGMKEGVNLGPLYSREHLEKVHGFVERAVEQGARLLCGGKPLQGPGYNKGNFYPVTLFSDVTSDMEIAREEVFGPVLTIHPVETFEEALALANDVEYGLTSSIFTKRLDLAGQFVDGIESGMVHVNHGTAAEVHMPFGGMKNSQLNEGSVGTNAIEFFTTVKSVYVKHS